MKTDYTPDFNLVWDAYRAAAFPNPAGSKFEAFEVWRKNELPKTEDIIEAIRIQKSNNVYMMNRKEFVPQWKHFCRWLKGRCWEDLIDLQYLERQKAVMKKEADRDRAMQRKREQYSPWLKSATPEEIQCWLNSSAGKDMGWLVKEVRPEIVEKK